MTALLESVAPHKFDGCGADNPVSVIAHEIVSAAVDDEIRHRGLAMLTESLGCFLECRIAQALRELKRED